MGRGEEGGGCEGGGGGDAGVQGDEWECRIEGGRLRVCGVKVSRG